VKKNPVGRPTTYKPEYAESLLSYFADAELTTTHTIKEGKKTRTVTEVNPPPTLVGWGKTIGVFNDQIRDWANMKNKDGTIRFPEFRSAYMKSKDLYKDFLNKNALLGRYSNQYAIFLAKNTTDMSDKTETDNTHRFPDKIEINFKKPNG